MERPIVFAIGLIILAGACVNNGSSVNADQGGKSSGVAADTEEETKMTAAEAERLAASHLALKQVSWGKPKETFEQDNEFLIFFETPERELRLLGQRTLIVDKSTRLVTYQKRR